MRQVEIAACPGNPQCSGHGSCSASGICNCFVGFGGIDCSLEQYRPHKVVSINGDGSLILCPVSYVFIISFGIEL